MIFDSYHIENITQLHVQICLQNTFNQDDDHIYFELDHVRKLAYTLPEQKTLEFNSVHQIQKVVIYNSLSKDRKEVVTLRVSTPDLKVYKIFILML